MSLGLRLLAGVLLVVPAHSGMAQVAPIDPDSELVKKREALVKPWCARELNDFIAGTDALFAGLSHDASCRTRMLVLETALDCTVRPEVRSWVFGQAEEHWDCLEPKQQFYFASARGQDYYASGRLDSALYFSNLSTELALAALDTTRFFLSLSNMSALFTEIRWYPEGLSTALWAYDLSVSSGDTASLFFAYVVNNLVSSHLDMGHAELASELAPLHLKTVRKYGNEELRELAVLNSFRIKCALDVGEAYSIWVKEHKVKTIHQRAKLASYLQRVARQLSDAQQEQLKQELFMLMDAPDLSPDVKLHFVVPALLDITDIPVSVRKGLLELELEVRASTNVFVQRDFYEVMAKTLQSSEYWEKYRNSVREVDSASTLYAVVYSNILRSINQEALAEHQKATYGEQLIQRGIFLLWAAVLCTAGLLVGLLWVLRMRRKALVSLDGLRDSQEQLRETEVRYAILRDQIQGLANQRSASIRKTALQEVLGLHSDSEAAEREQLNQWMDRFGLTRTEAEVLARIAVGWTNAELVAELNLAKSYIHNVRGQLRKKLNVPKNLTIEEFAQDLLRS